MIEKYLSVLTSYLLLPSELRHGIQDLSQEEFDAIIPSAHEISTLNIKQLAGQMVNNVLSYESEYTKRSDALNNLLNVCFYIAEDDRFFDQIRQSTKPEDNIWKLHGHRISKPKVLPKPKEAELLPATDNTGPTWRLIIEITHNLVNFQQGIEYFNDTFLKLAEDYQFILDHPNQFGAFLVMIGSPLSASSTEPHGTIINRFIEYYENRGMHFHASRMRLFAGTRNTVGGRFEEALRQFEIAEQYAFNNNLGYLSAVKNNRGIVLYNSGRIEEAIEIYKELLEDDPTNPMFLNNLSDCHARLGNLEKSWEYGKKYLEFSQAPFLGGFEFLQPVMHDLGLEEEHEQFMERVERILEEADIDLNKVFYHLMKARQNRYNLNMGAAVEHVNTGIEMSLEWKNLQALIPLSIEKINIFLEYYELRPTDNNRQRLYSAINALVQLCDDQGMAAGSIQALRLRAQINLQFDDLDAAKQDLYTATKLAEQFEYQNLYEETLEELEELRSETVVEEKQEESVFGLLKKKLRGLVGMGSTNKEFQPKEYTTHGSIIMSNTGLPIYSSYITDKLKTDSALISGLISAVSSMLTEAVQTKGFLKTIQRDDFSLLFEPVHEYLVVSIVSEDCFEARQKLEKFSHTTRNLMEEHEIGEYVSNIPPKFEQEIEQAMMQVLV